MQKLLEVINTYYTKVLAFITASKMNMIIACTCVVALVGGVAIVKHHSSSLSQKQINEINNTIKQIAPAVIMSLYQQGYALQDPQACVKLINHNLEVTEQKYRNVSPAVREYMLNKMYPIALKACQYGAQDAITGQNHLAELLFPYAPKN